ncbi:MAG: FAD-binding oxidoreductase [Beijerinckiaceae bacterium]|nr:FAD-binding oxidoreductase [Beijerinckiaceae bacterium]
MSAGHAVVIGAGIVGAASALALIDDGWRVTMVDPGPPGGPQAASHGNGAWINPASIIPMSMPGLWRKVPGFLLDPAGPLTIRAASLPALLPWLMRFIRAGSSVERVSRTAAVLARLLADAPARHRALAGAAGVGNLLAQRGLLYVYPDRAAFEAEALAWQLRRENGIAWTELDEAALHQQEPTLGRQYAFGILVEAGAHCLDPGAYVAALVAHAVSLGAEMRRAAAQGFMIEAGRLRAVNTSDGPISCGRVVIAAGIASRRLAELAGDRVSLASERGYHVVVEAPEAQPRLSSMPSDGKMANTLTTAGLRAAGQVELAAVDAPPDWRRADILLEHLKRAFPALPRDIPEVRLTRWMGHRPSTPDGLPVIGRAAASEDIIHAFGHGHVGLAAGPMTGRLVADIAAGRTPSIAIEAFSPRRF